MSVPAPSARAPPDEVRSLDLLAQRLQHLNGAIEVLKNTQMLHSWDAQPPPWPTIAHQSNIINGRLSALLDAFSKNQQLLNQAHPYPLPTFPGRTHEGMATQLTRKKMEPWVEDWIAEGMKHATGPEPAVSDGGNAKLAGEGGLTGEQIEGLWDWAGPAGGRIGREVMQAEDDEGEDEDEEDDEEEDEDEMEGVERVGTEVKSKPDVSIRPMMPLDNILKFVSTGALS